MRVQGGGSTGSYRRAQGRVRGGRPAKPALPPIIKAKAIDGDVARTIVDRDGAGRITGIYKLNAAGAMIERKEVASHHPDGTVRDLISVPCDGTLISVDEYLPDGTVRSIVKPPAKTASTFTTFIKRK